MKLRLSDITNLTDARYAAAEGFDWIGFNFIVDTPHVINSLKAKEIKGWLSGPTYFGKFNGKDLSEIRGIAAILSLEAVEIPIECYDESLFEIVNTVFLNIEITKENILTILPRIQAIEHMAGDKNIIFSLYTDDIAQIQLIQSKFEFYIHVSDPESLTKISDLSNKNIDLSGTDELKAGYSDWEQIAEIVEQLEVNRN
jgi:phosphoribosylanthranilate isomerase